MRKTRSHVCVCVCGVWCVSVCGVVCERERERECVCVMCGVVCERECVVWYVRERVWCMKTTAWTPLPQHLIQYH